MPIRQSQPNYGQQSAPAFDIEIYDVVNMHLRRFGAENQLNVEKLMPLFYSAAWELSLRGVLRPSFRSYPFHSGKIPCNGYSITERGRKWLTEKDNPVFIAVGDFAQHLAKYQSRFGDAYYERAQEAVKSFFSGNHYACCAMCGAASEAILLQLATEKLGDVKKALQIYNSSHGRKNLKDKVLTLGQKPDHIKNEVDAGFTILSYWRDDAAHGSALNIDSIQASIALQMLCLFALAADKYWEELSK